MRISTCEEVVRMCFDDQVVLGIQELLSQFLVLDELQSGSIHQGHESICLLPGLDTLVGNSILSKKALGNRFRFERFSNILDSGSYFVSTESVQLRRLVIVLWALISNAVHLELSLNNLLLGTGSF